METNRWARLAELLESASSMSPRARAEYLDRVCAGDTALRTELESLLRANEASAAFLEQPPDSAADTLAASELLPPGAVVGHWRVLRVIGRGGMGEVYEAERAGGDFEQRAAIKLTRRESAAQLERFNAERQLLARLDHPGMARLLDGGVAPDGRPYFVMEYIEGRPITEYCDAVKAGLAERLALFLQVCDAVAYAHRHLIVHRDIKPGNVLVDGDRRTRLLDFGIAKPLDTGIGGTGATAGMTTAILTPDYAAPEQLAGEPVTTATDVYGLGVLLFELLTRRRPWAIEGQPLARALHTLLERPAPRLSQAAAEAKEPPVAPRLLQGDLDAIVAKCLRREPHHRYSTVETLKLDIERSLRGDPVLARGDVKLYVLGRFIRRYRWPVAATAAVIASLAVGLIGVLWQAGRVALERDIAQEAAGREEAVRYHLVGLFRSAVEEPGGETVTAKTMLDHSAQRVIEQYRDDPQRASKLVEALADLYGALGDTEAQAPLLEQFLAAASGPDGAQADPAAVAIARHKLAGIEVWRGNLEAAQPLLAQAEAFWASAPDRYREQRLEAALIRGQLQRAQGRITEAIDTYREALSRRIELSGRDHRETATLYNSLAIALATANRFDEALASYRESLAIHERLGRSEEIDALVMLGNTGALALQIGRLAEAETILKTAVEKQQAVAGESAAVAAAMGRQGVALGMRARFPEALAVLTKAVAMAEREAGAGSPVATQNRLFLADALGAAGQHDAARSLLEQNLTVARTRFGEAHLITLRIRAAQARLALASGQAASAQADLKDVIEGFRKLGPPGETSLAHALLIAGEALIALSRSREAIAPLAEAVQIRERLLWSESWELAEARARLGEAWLASGDSKGVALLTEAAATLRSQLGDTHPQSIRATGALHTLAASR